MGLACSIVQDGDQVAVGGAGGGEFVVAFLEVLASVEALLFDFGESLTEGADSSVRGLSGTVTSDA
jgi:hypothetical protein